MEKNFMEPVGGVAHGSDRLLLDDPSDGWNPSEPPASAALWRYMSFAKFSSLLQSGALFFALVKNMADQYEGFFYQPPDRGARDDRLRQAEEVIMRGLLKDHTQHAGISCWTESEYEASMMWDSYAGADGVAIRTTYGDLLESLQPPEKMPVKSGRVEYVNYDEVAPPMLAWAPLLHKRVEYRREDEVRVIVGPPAQTDENGITTLDPAVANQGGIYLRVELATLVKEVVVRPHAKPWLQLASSVVERSSLSVPVRRSVIELSPSGGDVPPRRGGTY